MFGKHLHGFGVLITALPINSAVMAQDYCRDVLADALVNQSTRLSTSESAEADRLHYCSASLEEARDYYIKQNSSSNSSGGSAGVSWGPFGASGSLSEATTTANALTEEQYNLWKSDSCSSEERTRESAAMEFVAQRSVAESAVTAWRDCMINREGLSCWAEPSGEEDAMLIVNWRRLSTSSGEIVNSYISGATARWKNKNDEEILPSNFKLGPGRLSIFIDRTGKNPVSMLINLVHDGSGHSCTALVPKIPTLPTASPSDSQSPPASRSFVGQAVCWQVDCKQGGWVIPPPNTPDAPLPWEDPVGVVAKVAIWVRCPLPP